MKRYLLLAAGVCTLIYFVTAFFHPQLNPVGLGSDGYEYWHLSSSLLQHNAFAYTSPEHYPIFDLGTLASKDLLPAGIPCTTRVPGYPFILAAGRVLWDSPWTAIIINIFAYAGMCLYGFRLGDLLISHTWVRRIFNILLVFQPLVFVRWGIGADIISAFFLTGFVFHILKIVKDPSFTSEDVFWSSLWGVAANLTRSNLLVFTLLLAMSLFAVGIIRKNKQALASLVIVILIAAAGPAVWMARNKALTGAFTLSTQGGAVFYTVQLAYDLPEDHPLSVWKKNGKAQFIDEAIAKGSTFNQAETLLDVKLKSVVKSYYREHPLHLVKKWIDGMRTLFFFSYFDISDAIVVSTHNSTDRVAFANSSSSEDQNYNDREKQRRAMIFQISRMYKWLLALLFFLFPVAYFYSRPSCLALNKISLYSCTLFAVCLTALFTGAGGDRMRLPFGVLILLFCCLTVQFFFKKNVRSASAP